MENLEIALPMVISLMEFNVGRMATAGKEIALIQNNNASIFGDLGLMLQMMHVTATMRKGLNTVIVEKIEMGNSKSARKRI